jgi:CHC2 zinc finger
MPIVSHHLTARQIAGALRKGRKSGSGYVACCPGHEDRTPSLSLRDTSDGRVLLHCHSGCPQRDVIEALRELGLWPERERRWLSPAEWRERERYRAEMRQCQRHAGYFCLALEPLLVDAIESLPSIDTLDWDDDPERLALTRELAMVQAARDNPANQTALFMEWGERAPKLATAICAAGIERHKRILARIWGWISAQR